MLPDFVPAFQLTPREKEVLQLIAAGLSSKEIAEALGIKFKTVVCHRTRVLQKLDLGGTADLTRYAMRQRLVPAGESEQDEQLRQALRSKHKAYMEAMTVYNQFLKDCASAGLSHADGTERSRQLRRREHERHDEYHQALRVWADFVLGLHPRHENGR